MATIVVDAPPGLTGEDVALQFKRHFEAEYRVSCGPPNSLHVRKTFSTGATVKVQVQDGKIVIKFKAVVPSVASRTPLLMPLVRVVFLILFPALYFASSRKMESEIRSYVQGEFASWAASRA